MAYYTPLDQLCDHLRLSIKNVFLETHYDSRHDAKGCLEQGHNKTFFRFEVSRIELEQHVHGRRIPADALLECGNLKLSIHRQAFVVPYSGMYSVQRGPAHPARSDHQQQWSVPA